MHNILITNNNQKFSPKWEELSGTFLLETFRGDDVFTSTCVALDELTLLTAAHSVENIDYAFVHLGIDYDQKLGERLKVSRVILHHDYDKNLSNFENDLAIIKLSTPLPKETTFYKISNTLETKLERVGFGGRAGKNIRTWTDISLLTQAKKYFMLNDWCSTIGDSGGPVLKRTINGYDLVGIHSTLEGDHTTYAVKLSFYKNWIESFCEHENSLQA